MEIENIKVEKIFPYKNNPRKNKKAIYKVAESIKEYGFRQPIVVDENMVILAGHTRLEAAKKLRMKAVPVHVAADLTSSQKKAYRIMDNRSAQESEWDMDLLTLELKDLNGSSFDLSLTGFDQDELAGLLSLVNEGLTDEDAVPGLPEEPTTKLGDLWILGEHRLLCGDSTSIDAVDKLMDGNKADMVFTDPPYGIGYQDLKKKHKKIINDESLMNIKDLLSVLLTFDCPMYICCNWRCFSAYENVMDEHNKYPKSCIVWDKKVRIQNLDKFYKRHEFILYYGDFGNQKTLDGDVWQCNREVRKEHPTAKPVELCSRAIEYSSSYRNIVLDLFLGSGSTLIAAEKTNRKCYGMEVDPKYCDVTVERWEDFTGKKAELSDG